MNNRLGMNRRRLTAVGVGVVGAIAVTLLTNPYIPAQAMSPWVRESFGFDRAYADPDPRVLVVQYGESGSCPSDTVRNEVVQGSDRIVVTLTRKLKPLGQPCTSDYVSTLIRIALSEPLGSRTVSDGSRRNVMPVWPAGGKPPLR